MSGTLRALDMSVMRRLKQIIKQTCEETARGYGAEAEVVFTTEYPVLNSAPALTEFTMDRIRALIGSDRVFQLDAPSLGADDFAFFCEATDCCYFNIGCRGVVRVTIRFSTPPLSLPMRAVFVTHLKFCVRSHCNRRSTMPCHHCLLKVQPNHSLFPCNVA